MGIALSRQRLLQHSDKEVRDVAVRVFAASSSPDRGKLVTEYILTLPEKANPQRGAKLFVCAFGCQKRRIPLRDSEKLTYCGLVVLTDIINGTDRFVALN